MISVPPGRRRFLLGMGALAAGAVGVVAWPLSKAEISASFDDPGHSHGTRRGTRPNFVIVLADDVGYGELGCYGQQKIRTPHLDRLSTEGIRFTDAYSPAPVCAPARASLLTGLHTGHAPVRRNPPKGFDLPLGDVPTFADVLQRSGYRTGLFGKWGFGRDMPGADDPNAHGFKEFFGYLIHHAAHSYYPRRLWHNQQEVTLPGNTGESGPLYGPDVIMRRALDFLRSSSNAPFLLTLTLPLPHAPSVVPGLGQYAGLGWRRPDAAHAQQLTLLDTYVGTLVDELRTQGLADNTIVIFTSDNGAHEEGGVHPEFFHATGPYRGLKRNLYEGGIRVPFIVWSPKLFPRTKGTVSDHPTAHYDLLATMADLAGARPLSQTDGLSLRQVFTGEGTAQVHPYLYWLRLHAGSTPGQRAEDHGRGRNAAAAVRFGRWKLIGFGPEQRYTTPDASWTYELYDLVNDPGERHNVSGDHRDLVERGTRYLRESWTPPAQIDPGAEASEQPGAIQEELPD